MFLYAAVNVFQTNNIVFVQIVAGLHFYEFDIAVGGVFNPVFDADGDKNMFVGFFLV